MLRIARGSTNWVLAPLTLAILMAGLANPLGVPSLVPLSAVPFFVTMLLIGFFRDPDRTPRAGIVSPADGKVVRLDTLDDPDLGPCDRLSIFMGVQNVHVNRMPFAGDVRKVTHRPGRHVPAFDKDSDRNERVETLVRTDRGDAKLVQIAGAVARRIVPYVAPGDHLEKGDRMGLIRLGSRFDVLVPLGTVAWKVSLGDKVRANWSTVADWEGA